MPPFAPGESAIAVATFPTKPAGLLCTAELWLASNMTKVATSDGIAFIATGEDQSISLPIALPGVEGTYPVFLDVFSNGQHIVEFRGDEDIEIALPVGWVPCITDTTVPTAQDLQVIENYEMYQKIGLPAPYDLVAAYSAVQLWLDIKSAINTMVAAGENLSNAIARYVGYRGGDENYWAYAAGHVPRNCNTWEEMALGLGGWQAILTIHSGIALMLLPDGSTVLATEVLVEGTAEERAAAVAEAEAAVAAVLAQVPPAPPSAGIERELFYIGWSGLGYEAMRDACMALAGGSWQWAGYFTIVLAIREQMNQYQAALPAAQHQLYAAQQDLSYWDVIVARSGSAIVTVRDQIETFQDALVRMGWCYIDPY